MDPFASDSDDQEPQNANEVEDGASETVQNNDEQVLERPKVSTNALNRRNIVVNDSEAALAGISVAAYNATSLETELIHQAEEAFEEAQGGSYSKAKVPEDRVQSVLGTTEAIKLGDSTPFDLLQVENQRRIGKFLSKNKKSNKVSRIVCPKQPSTSKNIDEDLYSVEDDAYEPSDVEYSTDSELGDVEDEIVVKKRGRKRKIVNVTNVKRGKDDGNEHDFLARITQYQEDQLELQSQNLPNDLDAESYEIIENFKVNELVWNKLYKYQKTGVRWLLQLHNQLVGGILADEMGLGKTIQMVILLRTISESRQTSKIFKYKGLGPTLIVAPATLLHQWVKELNTWFPKCRVAVFHSSSGSFSANKGKLLKMVTTPRPNGTVLVTSYSTYTIEYKRLLKVNWHYVILDEGHKIRNPETKVTTSLKELRTPHRILLSGSPMQNNLKELWSLIDFVYPGRLGGLKEFNDRFAIPITQGGFASASQIQVRTAYKCACILRDAINPYMLRRMKKDVEMVINLPTKTEQVLFCDITDHQRTLYKEYIESRDCRNIIAGQIHPFAGLITLRKLCNHPDLITGGPNKYGTPYDHEADETDEFGHVSRSGKLTVTQSLLKLWKKQGHKVLLFSQSKQMLTVLEKMVLQEGYNYLRMDGSTPIARRQPLVNEFNKTESLFVFLLTTRVGGLGLNLTGANRVLIYDPDWNPSTDAQARERAWRIGQDRQVTIYRLMTSGTIEEKMYQRQVFKQFLANKILVDPKQKRFFKTNDLMELFTLVDSSTDKEHGTETAALFHGQAKEVNKKNFFDEKSKKDKKKLRKEREIDEEDENESEAEFEMNLTKDYKRQLWAKAQESLTNEGKDLTKTYRYEEMDENMKKRIDELPEDHPIRKRIIFGEGTVTENNEEGEIPDEGTSKTKEKSKKKSKKLLDGKFEIKFLRKQRDYKQKPEEHQEQDEYVLKHLLKNAGVHSALQHDHVMGENKERADIQLIEDEAENVAKRAAEVLKQSRRRHDQFIQLACSSEPKQSIFGRKRALVDDEEEKKDEDTLLPDMFNGGLKSTGPVMKKKSDGTALSSNELFLEIKQRRADQLEDSVAIRTQGAYEQEWSMFPSLVAKQKKPDIALGDRYEKLGEDIRAFFVSQNGRSTTNALLTKFKSRVKPQDSYVFRSILRKIADKLPNSHWALKPEFA